MAEEKKQYKFTFKITGDLCMDCATCWYECVYEGGSGAVKVGYNGGAFYEIDEETCIRCGRCYRACPVNAVERIKN
jgi:energy-converting hydrogenase A subunit Q